MCGIFGVQTPSKKINIKEICHFAKKSLFHRGPDEQNIIVGNDFGLAHSRLSIIDVKNGSQPMISENKRYSIVYNGEIINFLELKKKYLSKKKLKTNSDTEVLLELYNMLGSKMLEHIEGMYAFGIFDNLKKSFFLARDHIGIKPLYYFKANNIFAFSSEVKAFYSSKIKKFEINRKKIDEFTVHGYVYGNETMHKDVYELNPGHFLIGSNKKIQIKKFWDVNKNFKESKLNFVESSKNLERRLIDVIKEWCISDVKVGCLLSGGLDSTFVATIASKVKKVEMFTSYSNKENGKEDLKLAKLIAEKTNNIHHKIKINDNFSYSNIEKLITHLCDPIQDLNSLTFYSLCKFIKDKTNIKVILTGEGSDELFGGYSRHIILSENFKKNRNVEDILLSMNYLSANRLKFFLNKNYELPKSRKSLKNQLMNNKYDSLKKVLLHDQMTFLPGYIDRIDKISMMCGLEMRTPFLDKRIISISNQCPSKYKTFKSNNIIIRKYILRKIFQKYVSNKIVWNRSKYQFAYPTSTSFREGSLNKIFLDLINKKSKISEYYDIDGLLQMLEAHKHQFSDHSNLLGRILSLEIFARQRIS